MASASPRDVKDAITLFFGRYNFKSRKLAAIIEARKRA